MINIEEIKNELTDEQLTKLNDIESHPDYFNRLENKSKEEIINYLERWTIQPNNSFEGNVSNEEPKATKKAKGRLTDEERLAKFDEEIAKHEQIIKEIKIKKAAIEENQIKKLLANHTYSEIAELLKSKEN